MMTKTEKLAFLRAKFALIADYLEPTEPGIRMELSHEIENLSNFELPAHEFLRSDRDCERMFTYGPPEMRSKVYAKLMKQFGYVRLGGTGTDLLKAIIERQRIRNDNEAYIVRDALAGDFGELTNQTKRALAPIVKAYEQHSAVKSIKRRRNQGT